MFDDFTKLQEENIRLHKIIEALIYRVEEINNESTTDFGIFQNTVLFESKIKKRTQKLELALKKVEVINNDLVKEKVKFSSIFERLPVPTMLTRLEDGIILEISQSFLDFFGSSKMEIVGRSTGIEDLGLWTDKKSRQDFIDSAKTKKGQIIRGEASLKCMNGEMVHVNISARCLEIGKTVYLISEYHDITQLKIHQKKLDHLVHHDTLTGIPNRRFVIDFLKQELSESSGKDKKIAVCFLDLDGFKEVNDKFGHAVGDELLIQVANRIQHTIRSTDVVARLGGDEFIIILCGRSANMEFTTLLKRLISQLSEPYAILDRTIEHISASIGFSTSPEDGFEPEALLDKADQAMYQAKNNGKNQFYQFSKT